MKAKQVVAFLLIAILIGVDIGSIIFVHHYVGLWTTLIVLVATTALGLSLVKITNRKMKLYIRVRYPEPLPRDIAAIVAQRYLFSAFLTLAVLFPGFISDILVILFILPQLSERFVERSIQGYQKEAERLGRSVEELCPPISCPTRRQR